MSWAMAVIPYFIDDKLRPREFIFAIHSFSGHIRAAFLFSSSAAYICNANNCGVCLWVLLLLLLVFD